MVIYIERKTRKRNFEITAVRRPASQFKLLIPQRIVFLILLHYNNEGAADTGGTSDVYKRDKCEPVHSQPTDQNKLFLGPRKKRNRDK
jgi:hypothetical protein